MHGFAITLVLLSAILHATWNAQLKGCDDRAQFMLSMCITTGILALICAPFVPWPSRASWMCVGVSAVLHTSYNLLLLQNYKRSDLGSAYAIARGISPSLVTLGAFVLMRQHPSAFSIGGVLMISAGIIFLSTGEAKSSRFATFLTAKTTGCL